MTPTQPNKTGKATASDMVMTPPHIAHMVVEHFAPSGSILEPAAGTGNFLFELRQIPHAAVSYTEINEGLDFFDFHYMKYDWIITNPPYSIYDAFLEKCFEVADNVVLLVPLQKAFKSVKNQHIVDAYGGLKEVYIIGSGNTCGFAFGFLTGCLYYQRGYSGPITRTWAKL